MKRFLSIIYLLSITAATQAQGLYIKAGIGYALPLSGQTLDADGNPYSGSIAGSTSNNSNTAFDIKKVSFATGLQGIIGVGYQLKNKHIGFEITAGAIAPPSYTLHANNVLNPSGAYFSNATITSQAQVPLFLIPSVVLQTAGKTFNFYTRFGLALPLYAQVKTTASYTYQNAYESVEHMNETTSTGFSVGIASALGASYNVQDNFKIWLEVNTIDISLYAKETKITQHDVDGTAVHSSPGAGGSTVKYGYNGTYGGQLPAYSMPFSNVGIMAGISISFNKKAKTADNTNR